MRSALSHVCGHMAEYQQTTPQPTTSQSATFQHLPGENRNVIYELVVPKRTAYELTYPLPSGAGNFSHLTIFHIDHFMRDEAFNYHFKDAKVFVKPRLNFYTIDVPKSLARLPTEVMTWANELEVWACFKIPRALGNTQRGYYFEVRFTKNERQVYRVDIYRRWEVTLPYVEAVWAMRYIRGKATQMETVLASLLAEKEGMVRHFRSPFVLV